MNLLFRRGWILAGLAQTVAAQQEDFGVFNQTIGNRHRNGCIEEDVAPVGKRGICCDDGGTLLAMARRDNLIEEIGSLLIERQVT
jgi:hypothetical protein